MSGDLTAALDRPYAQDPETRLAAAAYVVRRGVADPVLAALGLDDVEAPDLAACPYCTTRLAELCVWHGEHATAPAAAPAVAEVPKPTALTVSPAAAAPTGGYRIVNGRTVCAVCGRRTRPDGICRQRHCRGAR